MVSTLDAGERAKQERRRQILSAAKAVFAEAGYHGASIHAIIERAQIARGTFYLYFESKAAVFDSILDQAMGDLRARLHRIEVNAPGAPPPQVQLREQVVATLEYVVNDRPLATLLLSAGHTPDVDASERLEMFFTEVRDLLRRALETGMELGLVRRCPSELVAAALLGMIRGVIELMVRRADAARPLRVAGAVNEGMNEGMMEGMTGGMVEGMKGGRKDAMADAMTDGMQDTASATAHSMVNDAVTELLQVALRGVLA